MPIPESGDAGMGNLLKGVSSNEMSGAAPRTMMSQQKNTKVLAGTRSRDFPAGGSAEDDPHGEAFTSCVSTHSGVTAMSVR